MDSMSLAEKASLWIKNSVILKFLGIGILIMILMIPMSMLSKLVYERSMLQRDAIEEISSKWGNEQTLTGPVLTIPYTVVIRTHKKEAHRELRYAHFLPDQLTINGELLPHSRYRGIYKALLYEADLDISGSYTMPDLNPEQIGAESIYYERAFIQLGIPDMRGICGNVVMNWDGEQYTAVPGIPTADISTAGIHIPVKFKGNQKYSPVPFSFKLNLNGSGRLSFVPVGKETKVTLRSTWNSPSFDGTFLPKQRSISDKGFSAEWRVLHFNRNFPQSWLGSGYNLETSLCGVSMITPVDHYHMVTRSVKYAALIIFLTFLLFFMIEMMKKFRVHPFQYLLIGTGLVLFYSLLLSVSEQVMFPAAYAIAAGSTTLLLSLYTYSVVRNRLQTLLVGALFCVLYGFLYIILRSEDYALLIGSTGLFLLLGTVMFLTRNVNWYRLNRGDVESNSKEISTDA